MRLRRLLTTELGELDPTFLLDSGAFAGARSTIEPIAAYEKKRTGPENCTFQRERLRC
jgi:hypothetical protein